MTRKLYITLLLLACLSSLTGCGQKGPLVLPESNTLNAVNPQ